MKKNYSRNKLQWIKIAKVRSLLLVFIGLLFNYNINAQQTASEKKVDYLERIYFSGENKEGLNQKILVACQELQESQPTPALAKQVTFLLELKDKANAAKNACEILDLLSVGIYNIDAAEATKQGVRMPSDKAKTSSVDALASLDKLNSTSTNLGSNATNLAWSNYLLTGGKSSSFTSGASKLAGAANAIGNTAGALKQGGQTLKQAGDVLGSFGIGRKKDKPCDDVAKKDIEIGEHIVPGATMAVSINATEAGNNVQKADADTLTTIINISKVSSSLLRALTDTLRNKPGIKSVDKAYKENISTITVRHSGSTDALADWLEDKFGSSFKLVNYDKGLINLALKTK